MNYLNAKQILPPELLKEVQKHINGAVLYVPSPETEKKNWGEGNGSRTRYNERNTEIKTLYREGRKVAELARDFFLSADSIRKIVK